MVESLFENVFFEKDSNTTEDGSSDLNLIKLSDNELVDSSLEINYHFDNMNEKLKKYDFDHKNDLLIFLCDCNLKKCHFKCKSCDKFYHNFKCSCIDFCIRNEFCVYGHIFFKLLKGLEIDYEMDYDTFKTILKLRLIN